jgi:proteasome lid subunit RPN8/RPN11
MKWFIGALLVATCVVLQGSVFISTEAYEALRADAIGSYPEEAVGFLMGYEDTTGTHIVATFPCDNVADLQDPPQDPTAFSAVPADCVPEAHNLYPDLIFLGQYHSHTSVYAEAERYGLLAVAYPSEVDRSGLIRGALIGMPMEVIMAVQPWGEVWMSLWSATNSLMVLPRPFIIEQRSDSRGRETTGVTRPR